MAAFVLACMGFTSGANTPRGIKLCECRAESGGWRAENLDFVG